MDVHTYAHIYARMDGQTFETGFIRSTLSKTKSQPNNTALNVIEAGVVMA